MANDSLSNSLSKFISANGSSQFDNPFDDNTGDIQSSKKSQMKVKIAEDIPSEYSQKKKKKDKFSRIMERGNAMVDAYLDEDLVEDFDGYLGNFLMDDEDIDLKRNLLRQGRKYARDNRISGEASEINKAYSESEKLLSELLKEIDTDKELVQQDITNMRMMRTRNYKTLSDLIESKAQFHNTALSVIKEMNSMKKNQIELQMKVDKVAKEENNDDSSANMAIQKLFSVGRDNLLGGGYADISGANEAGLESDDYSSYVSEDDVIQQKYSSNDDYEESDGDKFLKYEGMGVHYILLYDENSNYKEIIAEDKNGNIVPDYPMPGTPDDLSFDFSPSTGTATDNLANQYELRKM